MSEIKLLNCPFCGGEAEIEEHKFWNDITRSFDIKTYGVKCQKCSTGGFQFYRLENDAIIHWNTRKPMERINERLEDKLDKTYLQTHLYKHFVEGEQYALDEAIEIVKEEGGIE
jgi:hypothetical protein